MTGKKAVDIIDGDDTKLLQQEAARWFTRYSKTSIPVDRLQIQFSRSSGPGGQNVNKGVCVL